MKKTLQIALGALGLVAASSAWTSPAFAIDGLTANADLTSNYVFRGIAQAANRPAVQGGLDYAVPDTGIAVGTWVSSIDFGDHTPIEWDIYANYNFTLGPVAASVGVIGYVYEWYGNFGPYTWVEPNIGISHDFGVFAWNAKAFWAPSVPAGYLTIRNQYNPDSSYYLQTGISIPVAPWLAASGNVGYQGYNGGPTGHPNDDYSEWDLGVTVTLDKYSLDLRYVDTSKHIQPAIKAATIAAVGAPAFDTGPYFIATFKFAFP